MIEPTEDEKEIVASDGRRHDFFILDNAAIDTALPAIGRDAFALYCLLVRRAYRQTDTTIGEIAALGAAVGAEERTVRNWLRRLVEFGLVERVARFRKDGSQLPNGYKLRPVSEWGGYSVECRGGRNVHTGGGGMQKVGGGESESLPSNQEVSIQEDRKQEVLNTGAASRSGSKTPKRASQGAGERPVRVPASKESPTLAPASLSVEESAESPVQRLVRLTYQTVVTIEPPKQKEFVAAARLLKTYGALEGAEAVLVSLYLDWAEKHDPKYGGFSLATFAGVAGSLITRKGKTVASESEAEAIDRISKAAGISYDEAAARFDAERAVAA